jgi:hypothetical protein
MNRRVTGEIVELGSIRQARKPAPFEQMAEVSQFVAQNDVGVGAAAVPRTDASSHGVDKVQAEPAAHELPVGLVCSNLSHYYQFVTSVNSLTGYTWNDIL